MFEISKWYNNYQAPSVLMIDDLSDAYIDKYNESYKNDWGYLCESDGSAYTFLKTNLLDKFSQIKITFFVPYLKHNVINDNTKEDYKKYDIGERSVFSKFVKDLLTIGHEVAHHGSNHGEYIDKKNLRARENFKHEWEFFKDKKYGIEITTRGINVFKKYLDIDIVGGKFCGYKKIDNSLEIIDETHFEYWCAEMTYNSKSYNYGIFGINKVISFPSNFAGNSFVRLAYYTGEKSKDRIKRFTKYLQPIYNVLQYKKLDTLYNNGYIISIQEHMSPSTSSGLIQSANIISDISSLNKIYSYLSKKSIWYATCQEISRYIYARENSTLIIKDNHLFIDFNNYKNLNNIVITIIANNFFVLSNNKGTYSAKKINNKFLITLPIINGRNEYLIHLDLK